MAEANTKGWSADFRDRFSTLIELCGGVAASAAVAGKSHDMISAYRDGRSPLPMPVAVALCKETGQSLDWLCGLVVTGGPARSDQAINAAAADAAQFILKAAEFFKEKDPDQISEAIARRAVMTIREQERETNA
jgi:hypothetical protein